MSKTESVIAYLKENSDLVNKYFDSVSEAEDVSYAGFLLKMRISGTTKEGVDIAFGGSSYPKITKWLNKKYKRYKRRK